MEVSSQAVKFTDESYLSRKALRRVMGMGGVDYIWQEVVSYRNANSIGFNPFKTIGGHPFHLTLTPAIKKKIDEAEKALEALTASLDSTEGASRNALRRTYMFPALQGIRAGEGVSVSDSALKAMLSGRYEDEDPTGRGIYAYLKAVDAYFALGGPSGEDFLPDALARMELTPELTSFYRHEDPKRLYNIGGLDSVYGFAPFGSIEVLMEDMYKGLEASGASPLVKAVAASFFADNVMPFARHSFECAVLLGLRYLESEGFGKAAYYLPLSQFLKKDARYQEAGAETQKTGDLTYMVLLACQILTPLAESLFQEGQKEKVEVYRPEYRRLDPQEQNEAALRGILKEIETKPEEQPVPEVREEPAIVKEETVSETKVEEPLPREEVLLEEEEEPVPVETPKKEEPKTVLPRLSPKDVGKAALPRGYQNEPEALSEKEARDYARYLLETNPALSKGQARFYAFHCTMGRYYVIQQYKKFNRCAYETARTSMDKLASEGYYSKMQVKNKFVYTPSQRGENK